MNSNYRNFFLFISLLIGCILIFYIRLNKIKEIKTKNQEPKKETKITFNNVQNIFPNIFENSIKSRNLNLVMAENLPLSKNLIFKYAASNDGNEKYTLIPRNTYNLKIKTFILDTYFEIVLFDSDFSPLKSFINKRDLYFSVDQAPCYIFIFSVHELEAMSLTVSDYLETSFQPLDEKLNLFSFTEMEKYENDMILENALDVTNAKAIVNSQKLFIWPSPCHMIVKTIIFEPSTYHNVASMKSMTLLVPSYGIIVQGRKFLDKKSFIMNNVIVYDLKITSLEEKVMITVIYPNVEISQVKDVYPDTKLYIH